LSLRVNKKEAGTAGVELKRLLIDYLIEWLHPSELAEVEMLFAA